MRNVILTEEQLSYLVNLIKESTEGVDEVINKIKETYKISDEFLDVIKQFILNSDCKKITFEPIKMGDGVSLSDRVILHPKILKNGLPKFLFILFHEIAHQYQFKKYGGEKMYDCYVGKIQIKDACKLMKNVELVADEFASRKMREFAKLGFISENDTTYKGFYKDIHPDNFYMLISGVKDMIKKQRLSNPEEISEFFYNYIKVEI